MASGRGQAGNGSESIIVRRDSLIPPETDRETEPARLRQCHEKLRAQCSSVPRQQSDLPEDQLMRPVLMIIAGLSHGRLLSLMCQ